MSQHLKLVLALHNHQPVGNFDSVFESAFQQSYAPFLEVFRRHPSLKFSLHTSGCLFDWLEAHHPEYLDDLAGLVSDGQLEILGGAYQEAILPMLTPHDRRRQIRTFTEKLEQRFSTSVRGMWVAERVWEQALTSDISAAGIEYTVLDDFHFKNAGLAEDRLHGHFLTEDAGNLLFIFPASERLRYTIPFADPQETINYLRPIAEQHPGAVIVFGDDGEKFGTWPETHKHVYQDGWLERFFTAIEQNADWLQMTTLADAIDSTPPVGKIYLPDASYREMTEWALPASSQQQLAAARHQLPPDTQVQLAPFIRGGFWRNFKVKYPEADEMYARMIMTSARLQKHAEQGHEDSPEFRSAEEFLHKAQCNCAYWHGAFGGIYLPHLRNAVFSNIIASESALRKLEGRGETWTDAAIDDFNLDARREVCLENDKLSVLVSPARGGWIYGLDIFAIKHNLLATLARREEAYHEKIINHQAANHEDNVASIHDRVVLKQPDLDQHLVYDARPRKTLVDHFYSSSTTLEQVARNQADELGDFADGIYEARLRRGEDKVQVELSRNGVVDGHKIRLIKRITLEAGQSTIRIGYRLENLPQATFVFAPEFNFAGLPAGADDRYFHIGENQLGQLGKQLDLPPTDSLALCDQWLGIDVQLNFSQSAALWAFPVQTVSQSEAGCELIHQSVVVQPRWTVTASADGAWEAEISLTADTSAAESRRQLQPATVLS